MKTSKTNNGSFLITLGILLLIAACALAIFNLYESRKADETAEFVVNELIEEIKEKTEETDESEDSDLLGETIAEYEEYPEMEMPTAIINGEKYIGYIEIPHLNAVLPIIGGQWSDEKMKISPCLYTGSVYQNNMVIAGHNYAGHFGRINTLSVGSEIIFTDAAGNRFEYTVSWTETINGTDIESMIEEGEWDLTLFTCNYSGEKRIAVRCILKN